jgi:hypothetical protein
VQLKTRHKCPPFVKASLPRYLTQEEVKRLFSVISTPRDRALFNIQNTRIYAQITTALRQEVFAKLEHHPKIVRVS